MKVNLKGLYSVYPSPLPTDTNSRPTPPTGSAPSLTERMTPTPTTSSIKGAQADPRSARRARISTPVAWGTQDGGVAANDKKNGPGWASTTRKEGVKRGKLGEMHEGIRRPRRRLRQPARCRNVRRHAGEWRATNTGKQSQAKSSHRSGGGTSRFTHAETPTSGPRPGHPNQRRQRALPAPRRSSARRGVEGAAPHRMRFPRRGTTPRLPRECAVPSRE